jgi:hypothetical protein
VLDRPQQDDAGYVQPSSAAIVIILIVWFAGTLVMLA